MSLLELIRRFSRVGDTIGGAFGGSGTACLAANIERRSAIYIDIDSRQDTMCRPRWQRAQQRVMAEHMMQIRSGLQDYIKRIEDRPWLFPTPTGFKHTPARRFNKPLMDKTAELVKGGELKTELKKYNESFATVFTDPFCRTYIHPASSVPDATPDWLLQPATKPKSGKKQRKVKMDTLFYLVIVYYHQSYKYIYCIFLVSLQREFITVDDDDDDFFVLSQSAYKPKQKKITTHFSSSKKSAAVQAEEEVVPATQLSQTQPVAKKTTQTEKSAPSKAKASAKKKK